MKQSPLHDFLNFMSDSLQNNQFIKIIISHKRDKKSELKNVTVRLILLKNEKKLSFVYRYNTKDITKNFDITTGINLLGDLLLNDFFQADLFTTTENRYLIINNKNEIKVNKKAVTVAEVPVMTHDIVKKRFISLANNIYLNELGISTPDGKVKKNMEDKFRQIDKYIEILDGIIRSADLPDKLSIADMGCGKGYLTFALYDYLCNTLKMDAEVVGIEFRQALVDATNAIAQKAGFTHLKFETGSILDTKLENTNMLIALHACDTATDDAIYSGIINNANVIICAPCCHKQIRKQLNPQNVLKNITEFGILAERQAEMLTDTIRAMIMQAYGYKTNVFEFISGEHTPKNLLIVGIKKKKMPIPNPEILNEIIELKKLFNIRFHYLETLLKINGQGG